MRTLDIAQLYLRITIGGMLILHNIDNMQNYNEIISQFKDLEGLSSAFWFVALSSLESIAAIMLIIGWRVRFAATILIVQTILSLLVYYQSTTMVNLELKSIYTFLYIYILIAGGGTYSLDRFRGQRTAMM